ncbi:MAG: hypothetical protein AAFV07_00975, partial [Bacteroidota bacterium]
MIKLALILFTLFVSGEQIPHPQDVPARNLLLSVRFCQVPQIGPDIFNFKLSKGTKILTKGSYGAFFPDSLKVFSEDEHRLQIKGTKYYGGQQIIFDPDTLESNTLHIYLT